MSGLGTWLVAPENTIHLGASGVVFGYATYLIARGIFNRAPPRSRIGLVVVLIWGGALLGGLAAAGRHLLAGPPVRGDRRCDRGRVFAGSPGARRPA